MRRFLSLRYVRTSKVTLTTGFGWLVVLGLTALCDSISVDIGSSPKESKRVKIEERKNTQPAPNATAIGPCPTIIQRTSDSCNVNLPIKSVKIKFLIYPRISLEICSSQLPLAGYKSTF